jgi:hypothetical protein
VEQVYCFFGGWTYLQSMVFDNTAGVFKTQDKGLDWRCGHTGMIDPAAEAGLILERLRGPFDSLTVGR